MGGEKGVDRVDFGEERGEIAATLFDQVVTILFGLGPIIFKLGINVFPLNVLEELSMDRRVGDHAGSEKVGD